MHFYSKIFGHIKKKQYLCIVKLIHKIITKCITKKLCHYAESDFSKLR